RLDERRAAAGASALNRRGGGQVHIVGVIAVDDDRVQAVGGRAVGGRARHGGDIGDRGVLHVQVVLADEDDRQPEHRGVVERLVERADVGGAVAEEADGDLPRAAVLGRPGGAVGDGQV